MAQRKQLSWAELRVGVFVLLALCVLALAIFYVTGGGFMGPKYTLKTYLPEASGLQSGAPVELDGVTIGNVQSVRLTEFNPGQPANRSESVTVIFRVDERYQHQIRTDSRASLTTQGLLGDRYVDITRGFTGMAIPNNGIVPGVEKAPMQQIEERGAEVMANLQALSEDLAQVIDQVQRGQGTVGKFINDPSMYNHLDDTIAKLDAMVTQIQQGNGSLGKFVASDEMYNKANAIIGDVQSMTAAIRDQKGIAGRMIYDPSLAQNVKGVAENANKLVAGVQAGQGSLGKFVKDDAFYNDLRDTTANVKDVSAKLNSNEGSLGKFFADPALYDNMTGLSGDLRLLINDFRANPKKFLRIKISAF